MLEIVGIIAGIVAATSILLFGSRGLVDLVRGIADRKKRVNDHSSTVQESVEAVTSPPTIPDATERPPSLLTEIPAVSTGAVFVGRQRELATLKSALEDAVAGRGRVVMLAGEPGIGKTRLVEELASYATATGSQVLWGRCYEDSGAPPYWPWIEVTRARVRDFDASQLLEQMGPGAAHIAEIVPEVRVKLPGLAAPPELEPEQARFQLFDSMTTFLANTSRLQPLVLALEDLHWADTSSLRMLDFLGSRIANTHLMVVGAYRDEEISPEHPLSQTLGSLSAEPSFRLETLRRFSAEETASLIEATGGLPPTEDLVQRIQGHTEGNPMFVGEVVRLLEEQGGLDSSEADKGAALEVPESVRAVTRQRLRGLSAECNQTLLFAAVVGREFDFGLLRRLFPDATEAEVTDALGEATRVRLVEELPRQPGRYQFSHSLIQQALAESLSTTARAQTHADIALALEAHYGDGVDTHAVEMAYHFTESQAILGPGRAAHYELLAGESAYSGHAYEDALAHFQSGLTVKGVPFTGSEPAPDAEAAALLFGQGLAQSATLETYEQPLAIASSRRAFDYYDAVGDSERMVFVSESHGRAIARMGSSGVIPMISRALETVPGDSIAAGRLLSLLGRFIGLEDGDYDAAQNTIKRALEIARKQGDEAAEIQALLSSAVVNAYEINWRAGIKDGLRALDLVNNIKDPRAEILVRSFCVYPQIATGALEHAKRNAADMLVLAKNLRELLPLSGALWCSELAARLSGEWQVSRDFNDQCLEITPHDVRPILTRTTMEYEVGDFDQGDTYLELLRERLRQTQSGPTLEYGFATLAIPVVSRISGADLGFDVASQSAEVVLNSPSSTLFITSMARAGLALMAVQIDDGAAAGAQYRELEPLRGTILAWTMAGDRLLGIVAQSMGELGKAASHFEDSLSFCRDGGFRPELAWTCCDYADLLLERNNEADRAQATSLLDESLGISTELGMRPLIERVLYRQKSLGT
ncbi:MAG: AAA family ATPase [Chloroflexi bacterium]|nr:AAA family ATPase [Chloroflexota bacterium]